MQPPVKGRVTIGLDPGYRTGCKVAVVDATGKVLDTGVIYPTHSEARVREAKQTLVRLIKKYGVTLIAIGNRHGVEGNGDLHRRNAARKSS